MVQLAQPARKGATTKRPLGKLEKPSGKTNKLLYHLEKGLILHYQGQYEASNVEFAEAERVSDQLYTRSVSRHVAGHGLQRRGHCLSRRGNLNWP